MALVLLATTGMRRGEVLGLRWEDIDFDGRALFIVQTLTTVRGEMQIGPPKTGPRRRRLRAAPGPGTRCRRRRRTRYLVIGINDESAHWGHLVGGRQSELIGRAQIRSSIWKGNAPLYSTAPKMNA